MENLKENGLEREENFENRIRRLDLEIKNLGNDIREMQLNGVSNSVMGYYEGVYKELKEYRKSLDK